MSDPKPDFSESREGIPVIETISGQQLIDLIYKKNAESPDLRFHSSRAGGVFQYFLPGELLNRSEKMFYSTVKVGDKIVGLAELEEDPYQGGVYWIKFVSVDPEFQGRGYASQLVQEIFRFAKEKGKSLSPSYYTDEGSLKMKHVIEREAQATGVKLVDYEK